MPLDDARRALICRARRPHDPPGPCRGAGLGTRERAGAQWRLTMGCLVAWAVLVSVPLAAHDLMPAPVSVELREGGFPLEGVLRAAAVGPSSERLDAYGYLKYISKDDMLRTTDVYSSLNTESIPVFQSLPLDLTVVAGVITEQAQTDLDHINLKSKQRNTPNVVFPNIMSSEFAELVNRNALVKMSLHGDDVRIEVVDRKEAEIHWQSSRPPAIGDLPAVRLDVKRVLDDSEIGAKDADLVGAKAANYAEMYNVLKDKADYQIVQPGFAIPFAYYAAHIKDTGIDVSIKNTIDKIRAENDPVETEKLLAALREELYAIVHRPPVDRRCKGQNRCRLSNPKHTLSKFNQFGRSGQFQWCGTVHINLIQSRQKGQQYREGD